MSECNHDCGGCSKSCSERIEKITTNEKSKVRHVIGVLSGKGGVGKSFVSSLLAVELRKRGYNVGVLDADITGPSIPQAFGIEEPAMGENGMIYPAMTKTGISVISSMMYGRRYATRNRRCRFNDFPIFTRGRDCDCNFTPRTRFYHRRKSRQNGQYDEYSYFRISRKYVLH